MGGAPILGPAPLFTMVAQKPMLYITLPSARDYVESDVTGQIEKAIAESDVRPAAVRQLNRGLIYSFWTDKMLMLLIYGC